MPNDRNGQELKPGDIVTLQCKVREVFPGQSACNVNVEVEDPAATGEYRPTIFCNSRLFAKVASALALALMLCWTAAAIAGPTWENDYDAGMRSARATRSPVLAVFTTDYCPPCVALMQRLQAPELVLAVDQFARLKVHALRYPHICEQVGITEFPTLMLAGPDGTIFNTLTGVPTVARLREALSAALGRVRNLGASVGAAFPTGVIQDKLADTPRLRLGERVVPPEAVFGPDALLPDVSAKRYGTIIARDAARGRKILDEINASPLAQTLRWQLRGPDDWDIKSGGFKLPEDREFQRTGLCILVQDPPAQPGGRGKRVLGEYDWNGVEALAESLRNGVDPSYDPNQRRTGSAGGAAAIAGLAGVAVFAALLIRRRESIVDEEAYG